MTKTALTGPLIVYGDRNTLGTGATGSNNADKAPSLIWGGAGLFDYRSGYNVTRFGAIGFSAGYVPAVDQVPATLAANNIATAQTITSTTFTLATATTGITVLSSALTVWASGNAVPSGSLVIDANPALLSFGLASLSTGTTTVSVYDTSTMVARALRVVSGNGGDAGTVTIAGYDVYGYPMSEAIVVNANGTRTGKKAFKFVTSATLSGGTITNGTIGTTDIYGFPLRVDTAGYARTWFNNALVVDATGFVAADATTATTTTGDVRGTYVTLSASDSTKRLQMFLSVDASNLGGLFGVTQA